MRAGNRVFLLLSVCISLSVQACRPAASQAPSTPTASAQATSAPKKILSEEEIRAKREKLEADLLALQTEIARKHKMLVELQKKTNSSDLVYPIYRVPSPEERAAIHEGNLIRVQIDEVVADLASTRKKLKALDASGFEDFNESDFKVAALLKQVNQLQMAVDFAQGAARDPDTDPTVKDYKEKLAATQKWLDDRIRSLQPNESPAKNPEVSPEISALQSQYRSHWLKKIQLEEQLGASQQKLAEIWAGYSTSAHLAGLEKEIDEIEQQRKTIQSELDELNKQQPVN